MSKMQEPELSNNTASVLEFCLHRDDESPIFGESVIRVKMDDEGAGPFIVLTNIWSKEAIRLDFHELDKIYSCAVQYWRPHFQFYNHSPEKEQDCDD